MIGFGSNDAAVAIGGLIDTTGGTSVAFSVPRDGLVTSIYAYFSITVAATLIASTVTITAQLYSSTTPDNSFAPIPGTEVALTPPLTGVVAIGAISSGGIDGLSIPVAAGTRLMLVLTPDVTAGADVATILTGVASGGITIE